MRIGTRLILVSLFLLAMMLANLDRYEVVAEMSVDALRRSYPTIVMCNGILVAFVLGILASVITQKRP